MPSPPKDVTQVRHFEFEELGGLTWDLDTHIAVNEDGSKIVLLQQDSDLVAIPLSRVAEVGSFLKEYGDTHEEVNPEQLQLFDPDNYA